MPSVRPRPASYSATAAPSASGPTAVACHAADVGRPTSVASGVTSRLAVTAAADEPLAPDATSAESVPLRVASVAGLDGDATTVPVPADGDGPDHPVPAGAGATAGAETTGPYVRVGACPTPLAATLS